MNTFCRIFLNSILPQEELLHQIASATGGSVLRSSIVTKFSELDVIKNEKADGDLSRVFPDGFVHFNFSMEIGPKEPADMDNYRKEIGALLLFFWNSKCPAVAACDFEADLPFSGGYKNQTLPWPGK